MRREQEARFAWALATTASALLTRSQYDWLCVNLGAGDYTDAINSLLTVYADSATPLTADLEATTVEWFAGYLGALEEPRLRTLIERAGVALPSSTAPANVGLIQMSETPPYAHRPFRVIDSTAAAALRS